MFQYEILFVPLVCCFLTLVGCANLSNNEELATRSCSEVLDVAIHEHSFKDSTDLCAFSNKVVVVELKHAGAEQHEDDTVFAGTDIVHYKIETSGKYTFRFDDEAGEAHYTLMKDSSGNQLFRIEASGEAATVEL